MKIFSLQTLVLGLVIAAAQVSAAGFDCAKAQSWVEKTICADPALSRLDDALTRSYRAALRKTSKAAALRASQRDWLSNQRDTCSTSDCLISLYRTRLEQLEQVTTDDQVDAGISGQYSRRVDGQPDQNSADIRIRSLGDGTVQVDGNAVLALQTGAGLNARTGSFEGTATLDGKLIDFAEGGAYGCRLMIRLAQNAISVSDDNGQCGGLNVTFNGHYRKVPD
ncbi:lysozyme inhibitor LprI family protein [Thiorhodovibrio frisius]|uniref:Uncharacterized protein conserved in bacteria, putative lipoprotein n=1 Tax=Thiorhodovibrio frisius TaxID=631362 RepID=H8YYM5_9GAMM|nr:lysozyme inhibitor LprI family protein [Thiorhodovibrio frisius]EIC23551.1 uncharacterized protein conserved in bacteria, putative lipoprotein [Thiorhodovibrio frisius]WPL23362.1 hypothetical protein Thiofri_03547 [Thiorhodovibrio frisius]